MNIVETPIQGLFCLETTPFIDNRGSFARIFCQDELKAHGLNTQIAQMNMSLTKQKGAVRGLHFQHPPHAEIKIVRCLAGACFDVAVDLRQGSPTFLKWHGEILTPENGKALYIPKGFAHGFQALNEDTQLLYLHSEFYTPKSEGALRYDDPLLHIKWNLPICDLSERDKSHPHLDENFTGIIL